MQAENVKRKFKVGDKVVVVDAASTSAPKALNGREYTVKRVGKDSNYFYCDLEGTVFGIYEHGLEFSYLVNSPLMKALK